MPKFIGNIIEGSRQLDQPEYEVVKISYSQARLLPPAEVMHELDTSDRGGIKCYAKRWYRWYAEKNSIIRCPKSTPNMLLKALPS